MNAGYGGGDFNYPFYGFGHEDPNNPMDPVTGRLQQSSSGALGGGQLGYNLQGPGGLLVFGVEADFDAASIRGRADLSSSANDGFTASARVESRINYLGTVRGRLGASMYDGRFLPYLTGGLAYGGVKNTAGFDCSFCSDGGSVSQTQTQVGWTAGAGAEFALDRHLSFKVEYLYTDLGRRVLFGGRTFDLPEVDLYNAGLSEKVDANVVRAGVNFRF